MSLAAIYCGLVLISGLVVELVIIAWNLGRHGTLTTVNNPTISQYIRRTCSRLPWIAALAGALAWHFLGS